MDSNDKTGVIYIKITLVDEAYNDIHPDLIAQDIMPAHTTGYQWERVDAMPMGEVRKMLREAYYINPETAETMLSDIAAKYNVTLTDHE